MSQQKKQKLAALIESGETSLEVICKEMKYNPKGLRKAATQYEIPLPLLLQEQLNDLLRNPEYDHDIALGLPLSEIAARRNCKRQNIHEYVQKTGQQQFYRQQREKVMASVGSTSHTKGMTTPSLFQQYLVDVLHHLITLKCTEKSPAYEQAWKSYSASNQKQTFSELLTLFEGYDYAEQHGVNLSLRELGEFLHLHPCSTNNILKRAGLPPMYGNQNIPSRKVSKHKKQRVLTCAELPLTSGDIAYFSGVLRRSVSQYLEGNSRPQVKSWIIVFSEGSGIKEVLTYRYASQIYEAHDAGFTLEEVCEYTALKPRITNYALEHRTEIEKPIITALRRLYPRENMKTPYRYTYGIV